MRTRAEARSAPGTSCSDSGVPRCICPQAHCTALRSVAAPLGGRACHSVGPFKTRPPHRSHVYLRHCCLAAASTSPLLPARATDNPKRLAGVAIRSGQCGCPHPQAREGLSMGPNPIGALGSRWPSQSGSAQLFASGSSPRSSADGARSLFNSACGRAAARVSRQPQLAAIATQRAALFDWAKPNRQGGRH